MKDEMRCDWVLRWDDGGAQCDPCVNDILVEKPLHGDNPTLSALRYNEIQGFAISLSPTGLFRTNFTILLWGTLARLLVTQFTINFYADVITKAAHSPQLF